MRALVTGAAGFIGSHLSDALVARGDHVLGVDCFTPYYPEHVKRDNVAALTSSSRFDLSEADLRTADLGELLDGVDVVYHLAAQPGVRLSWADGFATYDQLNIGVTQRLLEACRDRPALRRIVVASSSSVYGDAAAQPATEAQRCLPDSPYGVTKLAAEALAIAYAHNFGVPTVCLRYFTVYGPRQRPDMAMARLIDCAVHGTAFAVYGSGEQRRDFTFVGDVVEVTIRAGDADLPAGEVINVAGGESCSLNEVIAMVEAATGRPIELDRQAAQAGDVRQTSADVSVAHRLLGWSPSTGVRAGIEAFVRWAAADSADAHGVT